MMPCTTQIDNNKRQVSETFTLHQNFPNPFNESTIISWHLAVGSDVDLTVYNTLGQKVVTLIAGKQKAGMHSLEWDAGQMASGVYYYRLQVADAWDQGEIFQEIKKMVLIR